MVAAAVVEPLQTVLTAEQLAAFDVSGLKWADYAELDRRAWVIAGGWGDYNSDPTPLIGQRRQEPSTAAERRGRRKHYPVVQQVNGRATVIGSFSTVPSRVGRQTTVSPESDLGDDVAWKYTGARRKFRLVRDKSPKPARAAQPVQYDTDDPYRPGGPLAERHADWLAEQLGMSKFSAHRAGKDARHIGQHQQNCSGQCRCRKKQHTALCSPDGCECQLWQPAELVPNSCLADTARAPLPAARPAPDEADIRGECDTRLRVGEPQTYDGLRAPAGERNMMQPGSWHVSANHYLDGTILPAMRWSTAQAACSVCLGALPDGQHKYCSPRCQRDGANLKKRQGRDGSVKFPIEQTGYPTRCWRDLRQIEDLRPLNIEVRHGRAWQIPRIKVRECSAQKKKAELQTA